MSNLILSVFLGLMAWIMFRQATEWMDENRTLRIDEADLVRPLAIGVVLGACVVGSVVAMVAVVL